ncbi:MAG: AccI family restriction endonuclease [Saprospiraceae bacterium]
MNYYEKIRALTKNVPTTLLDFELPRDPAKIPTQASSNFITNKEQGDWAERLIITAINETSTNFVAVKYGKSDDLVAGEDGFDRFYQEFQNELDTIGKRPDLLIFKKADFDAALGLDISQVTHSQLAQYVKKAVAGIEVRSSAFLIDRYEAAMQKKTSRLSQMALEIKHKILTEYKDILDHPTRKKYISLLESLTTETLSITDFKIPGWGATDRLIQVNSLFRALKKTVKEVQKRDYLSITPKVSIWTKINL